MVYNSNTILHHNNNNNNKGVILNAYEYMAEYGFPAYTGANNILLYL